tara:strand:- start:2741 stop:2899 length:159 start_codon:yes stop_codon:yes gene_type:complete
MDYTIKEYISDKSGEIIGLILCPDNGDEQYLTIDEYRKFIENRIKNEIDAEL